MRHRQTTGKLRLALATPYFNSIAGTRHATGHGFYARGTQRKPSIDDCQSGV